MFTELCIAFYTVMTLGIASAFLFPLAQQAMYALSQPLKISPLLIPPPLRRPGFRGLRASCSKSVLA